MAEEWVELDEFPNYAINPLGEIVNLRRRHYILRPSQNQQGIAKVNLMRGDRLVTKSLATIVATAFVPKELDRFNTIIHLDGNRMNCRADNLMWRPLPFAIKYHQQFQYRHFHEDDRPLVDIRTDDYYVNVKEACTTHGLIFTMVLVACYNEERVFPTGQAFRFAKSRY